MSAYFLCFCCFVTAAFIIEFSICFYRNNFLLFIMVVTVIAQCVYAYLLLFTNQLKMFISGYYENVYHPGDRLLIVHCSELHPPIFPRKFLKNFITNSNSPINFSCTLIGWNMWNRLTEGYRLVYGKYLGEVVLLKFLHTGKRQPWG